MKNSTRSPGKVERLFQQGYDDETRRRAIDDPAFQLPELWKTLAAQGILGTNVPANLGGSATTVLDAAARAPTSSCAPSAVIGRRNPFCRRPS